MNDNNALFWIRFCMKNLNLIIVFMISVLVAVTTDKIVATLGAHSFLENMETLPVTPWLSCLYSVLAFFVLIGMIHIKGKEKWGNFLFLLYGLIQLILCIFIMKCLDNSYNGIILLVIVDLIVCWRNTKLKVCFISMLFIIYVFSNMGLFLGKSDTTVFQNCLMYYNTNVRRFLLGLKNILVSGNNLLFMFYTVMLIRMQIVENNRILMLNNQLDEANEKLQEANMQLEEYAKTTEKMAQSRERNRLAREIHDTLGHALTGIIAGIDASVTLIDIAPEEVKKQLNRIGIVARQGMKDVRRSVSALRPDALESLSLEDAIKQMISDTIMVSKADIRLENKADLSNLADDEAETLYRIIQEGITNAIRHGKADQIRVRIDKIYNIITIMIKDNGVGCKEIKKGFGLRHMSERLEMLNGSLEYKSEDGFTILAKIPIRWGK